MSVKQRIAAPSTIHFRACVVAGRGHVQLLVICPVSRQFDNQLVSVITKFSLSRKVTIPFNSATVNSFRRAADGANQKCSFIHGPSNHPYNP